MEQFNKMIKRFSTIYFTTFLGTSLLGSVFVLMLSTLKGYTPEQVSLLVGVIPMLIIPSVVVWGRVLDRSKKLMRWSAILHCIHFVCIVLYFVVDNFTLFFIVHLIKCIVVQPTGSISEEYIINLTTKAHIPYGKIRAVGTIGYGLAGLLAMGMLFKVNAYGVLGVAAVCVLMSAIGYFFLPEVSLNSKGMKKSIQQSSKGIDFSLLKNREFLVILVVSGLVFGGMNAASGYGVQMVLLELQAPEQIIGLMPFVMVTLETIILLTVHKFMVAERPYRAFMIAIISNVVRWILLSFATNYGTVLVCMTLHGVGVGFGLPAQNYIMTRVTKENERSSAFLMAATLNGAIVPSLLNLLTGRLLVSGSYKWFGIIYLMITLVAFMILLPRTVREKSEVMH